MNDDKNTHLATSSHANFMASSWFVALAMVLLAILIAVVYIPAYSAGFIWDDDDYILRNDTLRSVDGLRRIWLQPGAVPQYYPLVHSMFWVEHKIWGIDPTGYHIVNVVLHAAASMLLFAALRRLRFSNGVAFVAAAVFALHPVHVESVAWITERKNVLSVTLYLLALLPYLRFDSVEPRLNDSLPSRRWGWYAVALICFLGALFSKTVTCSLPAAILLLIWWKRGRITLRDLLPTLPMFVLGAMGGAMTSWMEKYHVGAVGDEWNFSFMERFLIAGRNVWFYAEKLVLPSDLSFVYERWQIDSGNWVQFIFPLAAIMAVVLLWLLRQRIGRGPLVALLFFGGTLLPALGFVNVYPFRFSFVADHFQYLASIGLIVLIVASAAAIIRRARAAATGIGLAIGAALLATFGVLTYQQATNYESLETLWRDTLAKNPDSFMPVYNLAHELASQGRSHEAIKHYRHALKLKPDWVDAMNNLGLELIKQKENDAGLELIRESLRIKPDFVDALHSLGSVYAAQDRYDLAIEQFTKALSINPRYNKARLDLGHAYARQKKLDLAIEQFSMALEVNPNDPKARYNLAVSLRDLGRVDESIEQFLIAEQVAPSNADIQLRLGQLYAMRNQVEPAVTHLNNAARLSPEVPAIHELLGFVLIQHNRPNEAIRPLRTFITLVPGNLRGCMTLADLLITTTDPNLRDVKQAIILADRACQITGRRDPQALALLSQAHAAATEWPQAAMVARDAAVQAGMLGNDALAHELETRATEYESHLSPTTAPANRP